MGQRGRDGPRPPPPFAQRFPVVNVGGNLASTSADEGWPPRNEADAPAQDGLARLTLPSEYRSNNSARGLTAAIRVVNPLPNGAPVAFANETMDKPLPGYLGLTTLSRGRAPKN